MLKKPALLIVVLLLATLPAAAQTPCTNGDDLSWLSEPTPDPGWLFEPPAEPAAADLGAPAIALASTAGKPGENLTCTVNEDCNELPDISCSGTTCHAESRDCSPWSCQRGYVTCNGTTTYCSQVCPPNCTLFQCRQPCKAPGCFAACIDTCTCECETICP
jgi:hypothetical protein